MKLTCTQENLKKALSIVGNVVGRNTTLPILNNILIRTEKNGLKLSSTNLEIGVSCWIGGKVEEKGEVTVPAKLFSNFISGLPKGKVEIKLKKEDILDIKCNGYKINIKGLSSSEYPLAPKMEMEPILEAESSKFKYALSQISPAVSASESRVEITGVFLDLSELKQNKLTLVATDTYRLAEKTVNLEKDSINNEALKALGNLNSVIIPRNAVQELIRDLDDEEKILRVTIAENQILFNFGNGSLISRLLDGKYPNYKQIIPESFDLKVIVDTSEMLNAIRVASLFADASSGNIELKLSSDSKSLEINSSASAVGSSSVKIPAEISAGKPRENPNKDNLSESKNKTPVEDLTIVYNYKYLIDGLGSIGSDKAVFEINGESHPTTLTPFGDRSFLYLIMPIRA